MATVDRRSFLMGGGASIGALLLASCGSDGSNGTGGGGGQVRWQDHFSALQDFHADWAEQQAQAIGTPINYTYNDVTRATEALQLAKQSDQLPDVYSNILGLPLAALVAGGWLSELPLGDDVVSRLPEGSFTEGITNLDGKIYGLPLFSPQQYAAATWFNAEAVTAAGLDPDDPPRTYDDYRAALQQVARSQDDMSPMILALGGVDRMGEQINDLVQPAGFEGFEGLEFRTGEYRFEDDTYVNAIEFWKELNDSGLVFPGSGSLTVADARTRWGAGAAAYFPDGPWCAGGVRNVAPGFEQQIGVGPLLVPESGATLVTYRGAPAPQFFVAGNSRYAEAALALVESMTSEEYQQGLAAGMDQPPLDLSVVADADVVPPYALLAGWFAETVRRMPEPVVANPQVARVDAATVPVSPDLGNIVQGYLGGDISDLRGALTKLSGDYRAVREQALAAATAEGAEVSLDDYAFPDWTPGADYTYSS